MRWLITLLLVVLVAAGVAWLTAADRIRTMVGLAPAVAPTVADDSTLQALDHLRPEAVQKIELTPPGQPTLTLTRNPDGSWSQPGNWPVRESEVTALLNVLTSLRTRFLPLTLADDSELSKYGLSDEKKTALAVVHTAGKATKLRFGQEGADSALAFDRPCFVRVDDQKEVVRLGPDVFPMLARNSEVYRRRQLFPDVERVKLAGGESPDPMRPPQPQGRVAVLGDKFTAVKIEKLGTPGAISLRRVAPTPEPRRDPDRPSGEAGQTPARLATAWELEVALPDGKSKVRDRIDPAKLRAVVTAVPELWVEQFVDKKPEDSGLDQPERTLTVTRANGQSLALRIGKISRTVSRAEEQPPPQPFAPPPPPPKVTTEEYRYAKLDNNPLVFEVRTDKLNDLFADAETYRDPQLARFESSEATELVVSKKGETITLTKKKGNKEADREEDRQDRWYVGERLAESSKVSELLDQLAKLDAKGKENLLDNPDAAKLKELALDAPDALKVTVTAQARSLDGETPPPARKYTFVIGKDDIDKKKLAVRVSGWDRVNLVDDAVLKNVERSAIAYRSRRLFDTAEVKLTSVSVKPTTGDAFALSQQPNPSAGPGATKWVLTQPAAVDADESKATQMTGDLSRLEVAEYVDDTPKPEDVEKKYGLAKPRLVVDLGFTGTDAKPQVLQIGAAREGKPEAYARLGNTGSVFAIAKTTVDDLEKGALGLLSPQLWAVSTDKVTGLEVKRGDGETYKLTKAGPDWKVSGPFDAPASFFDLQPLLGASSNVKADKYEAMTAADPAKYGFDKPALRIAVTILESKPAVPGTPPAPETPVTKTLLIGKPTADGATTRFARLEGGPTQAVFALPENLLKEADKPALAWLDKTLLSLDPTKITRVDITGPTADAKVALTKDDKGVWKAEGAAFTVDKPTVEALIGTASRLPVVRLAGYGSGVNWATFGLDKPAYEVTFTVTPTDLKGAPARHTIKLGKAEPNGERYARVSDGPAVGVLLLRAAESLARGKLDFIDRGMFTFDPTALTAIMRKKGTEELELQQAGLGWEIAKPAKQKADAPTLDDLADQLGRLRATKVAAFAPKDDELTKFGLKEPAATITLKAGTDKVLKIGGPVDAKSPDGDRYAIAVPTDAKAPVTVGVLPGFLAKTLLAEPLKFRDKALAKFVDADKLTLEHGDRKVMFAKMDGTWKVTAPLTSDAEQVDLDEFVNAAAKLRADELAADKPGDLKPFGLDKPEVKWTFLAGDKPVLSLLVGTKEKTGPRVYAKTDKSDTVALLDASLTAKVFGEYRKRSIWSDLDASQAESLILSTGTANAVLQKSGTLWVDTAKPADMLDQAKITEMLAALAALKAERFAVDKDAKLELYGLDKPTRVLVVTMKGNMAKSLHLGGPVGGTGGKQVYAKVSEPGRTEVFVLSESDTAKLTRDRGALTAKK